MTTAHDAARLSFDGRSGSPEHEGTQGPRVIAHLERFVLQCRRRSLAPAGAGLLGEGEQSIATFFCAAQSRPERRFDSPVLVFD